MVRNPDLLEAFERSLTRAEAADYRQNLRLVEGLYREACLLNVWPLKDPLEGIDVDIHLTRVVNVRTTA